MKTREVQPEHHKMTAYTPEQKEALKLARECGCVIYYDRPRMHIKGVNAFMLRYRFAAVFGEENVKAYEAKDVVYGIKTPALSVKR